MKLTLSGTREYVAPLQISNIVSAGAKIAMNAFRETVFKHTWDLIRVALLIDALNAFYEIDRLKILDAIVIYALEIAR